MIPQPAPDEHFFKVPAPRDGGTQIEGIFARIASPSQPRVTRGLQRYHWYARERIHWGYVLYQQGHAVGHVGAQPALDHAIGSFAPRTWEMCQVGVSMDIDRYAVASALVELAEATFEDELWARCAAGSDTHLLLQSRGWNEVSLPAGPHACDAIAMTYLAPT